MSHDTSMPSGRSASNHRRFGGLELRKRCAQLFGRFGIKSLSMDDWAEHWRQQETLYKHFQDKGTSCRSAALAFELRGGDGGDDGGEGNAIDLALREMEKKHKMLSSINSTVLLI